MIKHEKFTATAFLSCLLILSVLLGCNRSDDPIIAEPDICEVLSSINESEMHYLLKEEFDNVDSWEFESTDQSAYVEVSDGVAQLNSGENFGAELKRTLDLSQLADNKELLLEFRFESFTRSHYESYGMGGYTLDVLSAFEIDLKKRQFSVRTGTVQEYLNAVSLLSLSKKDIVVLIGPKEETFIACSDGEDISTEFILMPKEDERAFIRIECDTDDSDMGYSMVTETYIDYIRMSIL